MTESIPRRDEGHLQKRKLPIGGEARSSFIRERRGSCELTQKSKLVKSNASRIKAGQRANAGEVPLPGNLARDRDFRRMPACVMLTPVRNLHKPRYAITGLSMQHKTASKSRSRLSVRQGFWLVVGICTLGKVFLLRTVCSSWALTPIAAARRSCESACRDLQIEKFQANFQSKSTRSCLQIG